MSDRQHHFWRPTLRPGLRIALHCGVGALLLLLFLRQIDWHAAMAMMRRASGLPIIIGLLAYGLDFLLRSVRFWMLLQAVAGRKLPFRAVPAPFVASFGISDLLPLRAGDLFRLGWFQRSMGLRTGSVLGAMVIERFYDLATLLLLCAMLLGWHLPAPGGWSLTGAAMLAIVAAPLVLSRLPAWPVTPAAKGRLLHRIGHGLHDMMTAFRVLRSFRRIMLLTTVSLACWLLEALLFLGVWVSLSGAPGRWDAPMTAFTASTLGTLVPGLPGHFGTFELFGLEAFTRSGIAPDMAAAVLLLAHLLLWAPTALFAIVWLPFSRSGRPAVQLPL